MISKKLFFVFFLVSHFAEAKWYDNNDEVEKVYTSTFAVYSKWKEVYTQLNDSRKNCLKARENTLKASFNYDKKFLRWHKSPSSLQVALNARAEGAVELLPFVKKEDEVCNVYEENRLLENQARSQFYKALDKVGEAYNSQENI